MPPVITRSAQSRSASVSSSALRSIRRTRQDDGSIAAMVIRPSGAAGHLAPNNLQVAAKFQNVSGAKRGYTSRILEDWCAIIVLSTINESGAGNYGCSNVIF